jgi:hypothetical protein
VCKDRITLLLLYVSYEVTKGGNMNTLPLLDDGGLVKRRYNFGWMLIKVATSRAVVYNMLLIVTSYSE